MTYGDKDVCLHWSRKWFVVWRYQAIAWTNIYSLSKVLCVAHLKAILQEVFMNFICNICSEITFLTSLKYLSRAYELISSWWRHQMETFSALLAICAGNSPVPGEFPTQRPVTRSFDVYFDLRPNKRLSKQSWGWWFETLSCSLWGHRNVSVDLYTDHNVTTTKSEIKNSYSIIKVIHKIIDGDIGPIQLEM